MRFVRNGHADLLFQFDRLSIKIFRLRRAPGVGSGVGVEKHRFVRQAFFHLLAQRIEMFPHASTRLEIMAEHLRHPRERRLFQKTKELPAIGTCRKDASNAS